MVRSERLKLLEALPVPHYPQHFFQEWAVMSTISTRSERKDKKINLFLTS